MKHLNLKFLRFLFLTNGFFLSSAGLFANDLTNKNTKTQSPSFFSHIAEDYQSFYNQKNLMWMGASLLGAGVMANTRLDESFFEYYEKKTSDNFFLDRYADNSKFFGERPWAILYLGLTALPMEDCDNQFCSRLLSWGQDSTRMLYLGLPVVWGLQYSLGAKRPSQGSSKWTYFDDSHAVSGHAFMGAVPFLSMAKATDSRALRILFVSLSTLPAWSRIHHKKHYLSQSIMGWMIAWRSSQAISQKSHSNFALEPMVYGKKIGVSLNYTW